MTNCAICNRKTNQDRNWCDDCLTEWKTYHSDYFYEEPSPRLIAEWAANRAREFEKKKITKLIEIAKDLIDACDSMADWNLSPGEQEHQELLKIAIKEYKKE